MNLVQLVGNLGKDPELKEIGESNTSVCMFTVATTEVARDRQRITEWHSCKIFGKVALACSKYLRKGSKVAIIGRLRTRSWDDNGTKKYRTEIIVDKIEFLSRLKKNVDAPGEEFDSGAGTPAAEDVTQMGPEDMF